MKEEKYTFTVGESDESFAEFTVYRFGRAVVEGRAKWDGCVDWMLAHEHYDHLCGPEDIIDFSGTMIAAVRAAQSALTNGAEGSW